MTGRSILSEKPRRRPCSGDRSGTRALPLRLLASCLTLAALLAGAVPAHACALSLVLAMDGSASVDEREHALQLNGLADALREPEVVEAIEAVGGIWVTSFEWSGRHQQLQQLGWTYLSDSAGAEQAAEILRRSPRGFTEFPTAIGYALGHASVRMQAAPRACARKVVDIAGDGINNDGFGPDSAYKAFDFNGITVNGLVISEDDAPPVRYYRANVIRGPGAFVEVAASYDDYAAAMKRKLLREIFGNGYASLEQASLPRPLHNERTASQQPVSLPSSPSKVR